MSKFAVAAISAALLIFYIIIFATQGYGGMILTFVIIAAVGVVLLLIARYAVTIRKTVTLKGVGEDFALRTASHAIWAAEDHLVGFPSGTFEPKRGDEPGTLVAKEFIPKGSGEIIKAFIRNPRNIAIGIFAVFAVFGFWGMVIGFFVALFGLGLFLFFFVAPLALAWLVEIAVKPIVRSRVDVTARSVDDAVELTFAFRGASALLILPRVMKAFTTPQLPAKYSGIVAAPQRPAVAAPAPQPSVA